MHKFRYIFACIFALLFSITVLASDKEVDTVYLGTPSYVRWETDTTGAWGAVKHASMYQVKLFLSDHYDHDEDDYKHFDIDDEDLECVYSVKTYDRTVDFSGYMEDGHTYFFAVRAIPKTNQQAYYVAGNWVASKDNDAVNVAGITDGMWRNYLEGSMYQLDDGTYLGDGWQQISGNWYYLANGGYRQTGMISADGSLYYLNDYGQLCYGWIELGGEWYYGTPDGSLAVGWYQTEPGKYYYFDISGKMLHDTYIDGYRLDSSGLADR